MFFSLYILFHMLYCLSGLNISYYPVVVESTNATNVSSFEECLCKCISSTDCRYFGYWSSISLTSFCQIYLSLENKPNIIDFSLTNYLNQTGLYYIPIPNIECDLSIPNSSYNYNQNASTYISTPGYRIISVIITSIDNADRVLAIDDINFSYHIFDMNTFQLIDNNTFTPNDCKPLCVQQYNSLLYIGCTLETIQVRQFTKVINSSQIKAEKLFSLSTVGSGAPQSLTVLNNDIIYYVNGIGDVYVLLTRLNLSRLLHSFIGFGFSSPSLLIAIDSYHMELYLTTNNGTLFRIELSQISIDNGTSISSSSFIDQYQMVSHIYTSILIDKCNRLWVLSSPGNPKPEMYLFNRENSLNKTFSSMKLINYTNSLPTFTHIPYNFQFNDNYSLFTANVEQGLYAFYRT